MPVSLVLCEGNPSGPDVRLLSRLLAGRCEVRPFGGKYGMGDLIKGAREAVGRDTVFGILDGDFPKKWNRPTARPQQWITSDNVFIGWRWERKEIENYLIDPSVVARALGANAVPSADYTAVLEAARDHLTAYQAARAALSGRRRRFSPLSCSFGRERGRERHALPDNMSEDACRKGIRECVESHNDEQAVSVEEVEADFDKVKRDFAMNGTRYEHYLTAFAGKDLLWAMDHGIRQLGFAGVLPFREKVLVGIHNSTDDIGEWLPEWKALQEAVDIA